MGQPSRCAFTFDSHVPLKRSHTGGTRLQPAAGACKCLKFLVQDKLVLFDQLQRYTH